MPLPRGFTSGRLTYRLIKMTSVLRITGLSFYPIPQQFFLRCCALLVIISAFWCPSGFASVGAAPDEKLRKILVTAIQDSSSFPDHFEAEVWLLDMSNRLSFRVKNDQARITLLKQIHHESSRAGLPPELVLAVIEVESNFDRWAVSSAGAQGLMQVMPFWLKEIGRPDDSLQNPGTNLRLGCTILSYYLDMENGDLGKALARYNGSRGKTWYSRRVLDALSTRWYRQ